MFSEVRPNNYESELLKIRKCLFLSVDDDNDLDCEPYVSNEQKKRDMQITEVLTSYVDDYQTRTKKNQIYRAVMFWGCSLLTLAIVVTCLMLLFNWIPIITGQYPTAETETQEQPQAADEDGDIDFKQLLSNVDEIIKTASDETDYAQMTEMILTLINAATGTATDADGTVQADISVRNVVSLITVCLTLLGAIIGLFKIIALYVFQQNEEKNVIDIVKSLQTNDYDFKKAVLNAKYNIKPNDEKDEDKQKTDEKKEIKQKAGENEKNKQEMGTIKDAPEQEG